MFIINIQSEVNFHSSAQITRVHCFLFGEHTLLVAAFMPHKVVQYC